VGTPNSSDEQLKKRNAFITLRVGPAINGTRAA
jgi:hypothetical protein